MPLPLRPHCRRCRAAITPLLRHIFRHYAAPLFAADASVIAAATLLRYFAMIFTPPCHTFRDTLLRYCLRYRHADAAPLS